MRLLLDTHTFLWFILEDSQLAETARTLIEDGSTEVYVSMTSLWEIAIKTSLGKLDLPLPFDQYVPSQVLINNMFTLPFRVSLLQEVAVLPFHHRDPFDRLLIAQCMVEDMPIISRDSAFDDYAAERLWASVPG